MTQYYFHVLNDVETIDTEGAEFPDLPAAVTRAKQEVRVLAAESVRLHGHLILSHSIRIEDADGRVAAQIRFGDAVDIRP